jgi:lysozyme family protein
MKANFDRALTLTLKHEGGWSNHPQDPGGATNKGITIGTLRRLGIDVDGDGDADLADLRGLKHEHVARVYRAFYWDAVKGDLLPSGVDMAVFDFAVNSGPSRAAQHLQRILGVTADGDIGPKTLAALDKTSPVRVVEALSDSRMRFLRALKTFGTFGKGWTRRVDEVRSTATAWALPQSAPVKIPVTIPPALDPLSGPKHGGIWAAIAAFIAGLFRRKA